MIHTYIHGYINLGLLDTQILIQKWKNQGTTTRTALSLPPYLFEDLYLESGIVSMFLGVFFSSVFFYNRHWTFKSRINNNKGNYNFEVIDRKATTTHQARVVLLQFISAKGKKNTLDMDRVVEQQHFEIWSPTFTENIVAKCYMLFLSYRFNSCYTYGRYSVCLHV